MERGKGFIEPVVGRVLWYWPRGLRSKSAGQPLAATVAHVHGDRLVNIGYLSEYGDSISASSVTLVQEGDEMPENGPCCEWMPYQKGQAAKTEAAEARLHEGRNASGFAAGQGG